MNKKILIGVTALIITVVVALWIMNRPPKSEFKVPDTTSKAFQSHYKAVEQVLDGTLRPEELEKLDPEAKRKYLAAYVEKRSKLLGGADRNFRDFGDTPEEIAAVKRMSKEFYKKSERYISDAEAILNAQKPILDKALEQIENQPQRAKEFELWQLESQEFDRQWEDYQIEIMEKLRPFIHVEIVDGQIKFNGWRSEFMELRDMNGNKQGIGDSDSQKTPLSTNPIHNEFVSKAQNEIQSWRHGLDEKYFDVVASQYLKPAELDQYFPTEQEQKMLKRRTSEMQRAVVSKIRTLVSEIPNATKVQKSKLARELVTANFDKDFADAVIEQLQLDEK